MAAYTDLGSKGMNSVTTLNHLDAHTSAELIGLAFAVPVVVALISRFIIGVVVACRRL